MAGVHGQKVVGFWSVEDMDAFGGGGRCGAAGSMVVRMWSREFYVVIGAVKAAIINGFGQVLVEYGCRVWWLSWLVMMWPNCGGATVGIWVFFCDGFGRSEWYHY